MARRRTEDTERTHRAVDETRATESADTPKTGEIYRCEQCGMELEVTMDCGCEDPNMVHLECCGQELARQA